MNIFEKIGTDLANDTIFMAELAKYVQAALIQKVSFDDSPWDGSASNWDTAEDYCADCLIDLNEGSEPKTKDKCKLPYRKNGSSKPNLGALRAIASGARGLAAVNAPAAAKAAAARKVAGWWQEAFGKPAPDGIQRIAGGGSKSYSMFFKDAEGQWWFWGIYSNKFEDRDEEIIPSEGHKEYIAWLKATGFKPMITVLHQPRMPLGFWEEVFRLYENQPDVLNRIVERVYKDFGIARVERVVYLNGFSSVVGKVLPGKELAAEKLSKQTDLGMSHGFIVKETFDKILAIYRSFEMSTLKSKRAANLFTTSALALQKENDEVTDTLSPEDRKFLVETFGEDAVKTFEASTGKSEKILEGLRMFKELAQGTEPATEPEAEDKAKKPVPPDMPTDQEDTPEEDTPPKKKEADAADEDALVTKVLEVLNVGQLQKVLIDSAAAMDALLKEVNELKREVNELKAVAKDVSELKKSDDEKIAAAISPINWKGIGYSASQDNGNQVKDEQEKQRLNKAAPTGTGPDPNSFFGAVLAPLMRGEQ